MSTLNELIAAAIDSEEPSDSVEVKRIKRRSKIKLTGLMWIVLVVLVAYEGEHILLGMGLEAADSVTSQSVEQMYDHAQQIMTARFEAGQMIDQPFNDPQLDNWIAVIYEGEGSYTLYYLGATPDHEISARNLKFSWE